MGAAYGELLLNGYRISVGGGENVLEIVVTRLFKGKEVEGGENRRL